ncbi:MAG: hypothetical protein WAO55_00495 [Candidatus Manganitrophaceae bacterium]
MMEYVMREGAVEGPSRFAVLWLLVFPFLFFFIFIVSNHPESQYDQIPVPERKLNLKGLEMVTTQYLDEHPEAFYRFIRILTNADNALQENQSLTRGAVMKWLDQSMGQEGFDSEMPVRLFLRNVYLKEWEGAYFRRIDSGEREYLYDLIGATIGGMYRCTCVPPELKQGRS